MDGTRKEVLGRQKKGRQPGRRKDGGGKQTK